MCKSAFCPFGTSRIQCVAYMKYEQARDDGKPSASCEPRTSRALYNEVWKQDKAPQRDISILHVATVVFSSITNN